jgi:hypothetical protein
MEETSISPTEKLITETVHRSSTGALELGGNSANCRSQSRVQNGSPEIVNSYRRLPGASSLTSLHDRRNRDLCRRRFMLVRLSKTKEDDDLGIHLVQQMQPPDGNRNSITVRFFISKLETGCLAARYCLTLTVSSLLN